MNRVKRILPIFLAMILALTFFDISTKDVSAVGNPYLNYKSIYILQGKTFKVKMLNVPKGAKIKWSSSNKKIATVKSGKVKGIGAGTCKITARYKKKRYTCKVKVQRDLRARKKTFKAVTLNMMNLKMDVHKITYADKATPIITEKNGTFRLKVYNTKKSVKWKSSKSSVATVSKKGLVTAKSKGICKITATVAGKKVSCNLSVTDLKDAQEIATQEIRYELLRRLNIDRIKVKAKPLKMIDELNEVADIRAKESARYWSHLRPDGQDFGNVYKEVGFPKGKAIGENLAYTEEILKNVEDLVRYVYKYLYKEVAHRELMLNSKYRWIGIGYYDIGYNILNSGKVMMKLYWAQELYTR